MTQPVKNAEHKASVFNEFEACAHVFYTQAVVATVTADGYQHVYPAVVIAEQAA